MTLTYIFHSGFVLETVQSILIFDYWLDPSGVVPPFIKKPKPIFPSGKSPEREKQSKSDRHPLRKDALPTGKAGTFTFW